MANCLFYFPTTALTFGNFFPMALTPAFVDISIVVSICLFIFYRLLC